MKAIVVASECTDGIQAIYVDGKLTHSKDTVYACDIVEAAEGQPIMLTQENADLPEDTDWPDTLAALHEMQSVL